MRIRSTLLLAACVALAGRPAAAQPPSPIDGALFAFPGSTESPPSGVSAGVASADQWLGDEPFLNPATPAGHQIMVSPTMFRVSRQDLRAANRNFEDNALFFDLAGFALALPRVPVWIYGYQPVLRFEDYVFNRGTGADPTVPPGSLAGQSDNREGRAGIAASAGWRRLRGGAALEWTRRTDRYFTREQSGAPDQGDREVNFEGDAFGYNLGLRFDSADSGAGRATVGAAVRYVPALQVNGDQVLTLLSGTSQSAVSAEREAGWEGGLSARYFFTSDFAALAAFGGRTEQEWKGFGVASGQSSMWRVAIQFHDALDPWTARIGLGQDQQDGVPEPRSGVLGLGLGWDFEGVLLDVGVVHRGIERGNAPTSYEDRIIASVWVAF